MQQTIKQHIKEYERLDDFIKNEESKLRKYKSEKGKLHNKIVKYIQYNKLQEYNIQTKRSSFEYLESNKPSGFTQKHIKSSLKDYFLKDSSGKALTFNLISKKKSQKISISSPYLLGYLSSLK